MLCRASRDGAHADKLHHTAATSVVAAARRARGRLVRIERLHRRLLACRPVIPLDPSPSLVQAGFSTDPAQVSSAHMRRPTRVPHPRDRRVLGTFPPDALRVASATNSRAASLRARLPEALPRLRVRPRGPEQRRGDPRLIRRDRTKAASPASSRRIKDERRLAENRRKRLVRIQRASFFFAARALPGLLEFAARRRATM